MNAARYFGSARRLCYNHRLSPLPPPLVAWDDSDGGLVNECRYCCAGAKQVKRS